MLGFPMTKNEQVLNKTLNLGSIGVWKCSETFNQMVLNNSFKINLLVNDKD